MTPSRPVRTRRALPARAPPSPPRANAAPERDIGAPRARVRPLARALLLARPDMHAPTVPTVLAVEDHAAERRLIYHALKDHVRLIEAGDAPSAIALLDHEPVALVLLDLHLPPDTGSPRQGLEVERHVRELPRDVPVVVVSADDDPILREALLERGVRAVLRKPVDPERLRELVAELLAT